MSKLLRAYIHRPPGWTDADLIKHFLGGVELVQLEVEISDPITVNPPPPDPAPPVPPLPPAPTPTPSTPGPSAAAMARIDAYAATHGGILGYSLAAPELFDSFTVRWYAGNVGGTVGACVVVDGPRGAFVIRNGFLQEWRKNSSRAALGAPLEDEHGGDFPAVQEFERGRLTWSPSAGVQLWPS